MSDPKYPYGATGYDPETGMYSWDEEPVPEIPSAEVPPEDTGDDDGESGDGD